MEISWDGQMVWPTGKRDRGLVYLSGPSAVKVKIDKQDLSSNADYAAMQNNNWNVSCVNAVRVRAQRVFDEGVHRSNLQKIGAGASADSNVRASVSVYDNLLMHMNTAKGGQSVT